MYARACIFPGWGALRQGAWDNICLINRITTTHAAKRMHSVHNFCVFGNALFSIRVDGSRGEEKNFFSREKAERRHRSFLLSPNPSPLFKKSGVFCKVESSPLLEIIYPYGEQSLRKNAILMILLNNFLTAR